MCAKSKPEYLYTRFAKASILVIAILSAGAIQGEDFLTDDKEPSEILNEMRAELEILPPGTQDVKKASAQKNQRVIQSALIRFSDARFEGLLALPARKIVVVQSGANREFRIGALRSIRFKELSDDRSGAEFRHPVVCEITLKNPGTEKDLIRGVCEGQIWKRISFRAPGQRFRGIADHSLGGPSGKERILKEVRFLSDKPGRIGGRS